jgi:gamma-glutamylaminecyclotransferase
MTRLFVYGTFKTGHSRSRYLVSGGAHFLQQARTAASYALFRPLRADYPCMVEDAEDGVAVEGEVWEVSAECLKTLDAVEGVPDLFQRRLITLDDGEQVEAYLMPVKPHDATRLGPRWD